MKVTFPHMGDVYIPIKMMFEELGIEVICPPKCSKKTLEIGTKCSPEFICVPFKINMGNFIEAIEMGADTVFMLTGCGPCRFGIFHAVQKMILDDMGYKVEFLTSDRFSSFSGLIEFFQTLNKASDRSSHLRIINTMRKGLKVLKEVDDLHDFTNTLRPREIHKGEVDRIYRQYEHEIMNVKGYKETMNVIRKFKDKFEKIEIDRQKEVLKVGIVGEIYTIIENFINLNIEKKLGNMGIEVHRSTTATEFVREQMDFLPFIHSDKELIHEIASEYLTSPVGGHGIHTIGNSILYKTKGYDGLVHLLPFTCMPEIVARSILPTVEKDYDIPILTLVLDELTGEAGFLTRLEAFSDLLMKRREIKTYGQGLSWN